MRGSLTWRPPFPNVLGRRAAGLGALGLVGIMVLSALGTGLAAPTSAASGQTLTAPGWGYVAPMTGAELQKAPVVTQAGTPLTGNATDRVVNNLAQNAPVEFTVGFAMRNTAEADALVDAQETPGSPMFHQWLSLDQEEQMFGPNPTVVQNTINYYTSEGFSVGTVGPMSVSFYGTAGAADTALHTTLSTVSTTNGDQTMNTEPLSVPQPLAADLASINGFEGTQVQPSLQLDPVAVADGLVSSTGTPMISGPQLEALTANESVAYNFTNHAFYWFDYFSHRENKYVYWQDITPASLTTLYDVQRLLDMGYNGNNSHGKQITIAIVMAGGINPGDLEEYAQMVWNNPNALIDRVTPVPVDRTYGLNGTQTYTDDGSNEMALDIEYSGTMAPGAHIMPVYAPYLLTNNLDDDYATIDKMATVPNIISNSWGQSELSTEAGTLSGPNYQNFLTMHDYFELLVLRGATILASSGDGGGFDTGTGLLSGSFPATDPYVLAVNGIRTAAGNETGAVFPNPSNLGIGNMSISTDIPYTYYPIHINTADELAYQSYWYQPLSNTTLYSAAPEASGGFGTSYWFNQSPLQHGITVPAVGRALGSGVSAEADFNESIFFDGSFEVFYGGTSFACPTTAGMLADVLDYLEVNDGISYLGDGNGPVFWVGNAWETHNVSLDPYFDMTNGTSYWGNHGVQEGWQWPAGQLFPHAASGAIDYGNSTPGWNFPSGWGVLNGYNFAMDLAALYAMPASFITTNGGGGPVNAAAWSNLATNDSYDIQVNETSAVEAMGAHVTVSFYPDLPSTEVASTPSTMVPTLTGDSTGYWFVLNTSVAPMDVSGLLVFTLGTSSDPTLAYQYAWVSWHNPTSGTLQIHVISPANGTIVGGSATFGLGLGIMIPPITTDPQGASSENLALVQVTLNGKGVYDAQILGTVANPCNLAWECTRALNASQSYGAGNTPITDEMSTTFTNLTGYAYVYTWNVIQPTTELVTATYGNLNATTNVTMVPPPNIQLNDNGGGKYSEFNWVQWILYAARQQQTVRNQVLWAPNSLNQSGWYNLYFGWQGEELPVSINTYTGAPVSGDKVWFGNYDIGSVTQYYTYEGSYGVIGYTNDTESAGYTQSNGVAMIQIPQNESLYSQSPYWGGPFDTPDGIAGVGALAVSIPNTSNETVSLSERCSPALSATTNVLLTCDYNNSIQRNYTSTPILVMPDPVNAWTQTPSGVDRNFFGVGANVSFGYSVTLPTNNPFITGTGYNWAPQAMHVTGVTAYVDGNYVATSTLPVDNYYQDYTSDYNLTQHFSPGVHELEVVVNASSGQVFTYTHRFIVGSTDFSNFNITGNTYTVVPYTVFWNLSIPQGQINNHTFTQSVEVQYVSGGCSGTINPCPVVVNLTRKVIDGVAGYNQSLNQTMLSMDGFYSGAGFLPAGQYLVTLWLNANNSGSITDQVPTYLVFGDLAGAFTGPTEHQVVPLGNVTISYSYTGGYLADANLSVYAAGPSTAPVYTTGIFVPAVGSNPRGNATTWDATIPGAYRLVMALGTPYHDNLTISEWINVSAFANVVYINTTTPVSAIHGLSDASIGLILAIAAGILGFLVGLFVAPAFRGAPSGPSTTGPKTKAWEEMGGSTAGTGSECPICHEHFETAYAMHNHQKLAHGIEE